MYRIQDVCDGTPDACPLLMSGYHRMVKINPADDGDGQWSTHCTLPFNGTTLVAFAFCSCISLKQICKPVTRRPAYDRQAKRYQLAVIRRTQCCLRNLM